MHNIISNITCKYINKQHADHQYHNIKEFSIHIISNVEFFNDFTVTDNKSMTNLRICVVTNNESLQIYESVLLCGHAELVSTGFENLKQVQVDVACWPNYQIVELVFFCNKLINILSLIIKPGKY